MPACRLADARQLHPRCATVVRRASTDRITTRRGRHRSNSKPRACGNRCSRATWAPFRRVADRTANSRRAAAATWSVRARALRRIARVEPPITARAMPPHLVRTTAASAHPTQRMEIVPRARRCRIRMARMRRQEPRTVADSVPSPRPRAARPRVVNPIPTRRVVAAQAAAATIGTVRHRVPQRSAAMAVMAVTRMAWAVDPRILLLRVRN